MANDLSRRGFLGAAAAGAGAAAAGALSAASYSRVIGANDRINIGLIGTGGRSRGHRRMAKTSAKDMNVEIIAVCDIWNYHRDMATEDVEKKFGRKPQAFKYSEDLLALKDVDAVMIATGDFQHAKILVDVVRAGKDCYCEKPMANVLEEAKLARDTVLGSKQIVQMGSQWVSDPYQNAVRDIVRSGSLGKISRIEQVWNKNEERWHYPNNPALKYLSEETTDWKRWLLGKPYRPFDPVVYTEFRLHKDFSSGIADQWMSHGSGLVHFYMDEDCPVSMVANGGIYVWEDGRENPDTFTAVATYKKGFSFVYQTQFGNSFGTHSAIMGKNGTLWAEGGEGSQKWTLTPKGGKATDWRAARPDLHTIAEEKAITVEGAPPPTMNPSDDSKGHFDNWVTCMRSRKQPNGDIHTGIKHAVAIIMAAHSYWQGKKLWWDEKNEQILDHPPAA
ncbi:MAG TPA: Gfo/Idh/MocA family oxidoreductase [Bryobacterales bacterium]|nr:Gfo/Idh/MocA family oxidoreductase [Bryobacterales bacterium]